MKCDGGGMKAHRRRRSVTAMGWTADKTLIDGGGAA
jgi:hypothetical protein